MSDAIPAPQGGDPSATSSRPEAGGEGDRLPSDYLARMDRDPAFAKAEALKHQSRGDKAEAQLRKLGRLRNVLETVDGDQLYNVIEEYQSVLAEPRMREAITTFRTTGRVDFKPPTPDPAEPSRETNGGIDEDLLTPFERQMVGFMRDTSKRLEAIDGRVQSSEVSAGQQALTRHLEQFFRELPLASDQVEKVKRTLQENVTRYSRQGEEGRKTLENLMSQSGYATVKALAQTALRDEELEEAYIRRRSMKRDGLRNLATDGPPRGGAGRELPELRGMSALDAIRFAKANPDLIAPD